MRAQQRRRVLPSGDRGARVRGQHPDQDGGVEHELGHLRRLLLEDLGDEVVGDRMAADLQHPRQPRRIRGAAQGQRRHLQGRGPPLASLMEQGQVSIGDLDTEVRQQVTALGEGEIQVTVADLAQLARHPQPVLPQRRVKTAGQHQLDGLGRPALDEIGHVRSRRGGREMEVIHDDRRARGQPRGIVGDRRGDIGRHPPVHREQVGGIGAEPRLDGPRRLDEASPEPDRVSVGPVTRQPGGHAGWPRRRPVRQQHALARPGRPHHNRQPLASSRRQPVMQHRPRDERVGQRRRPELRQREPRAPQGAVSSYRALCHGFLAPGPRPCPLICSLLMCGPQAAGASPMIVTRGPIGPGAGDGTSPPAGDSAAYSCCAMRGWWFELWRICARACVLLPNLGSPSKGRLRRPDCAACWETPMNQS